MSLHGYINSRLVFHSHELDNFHCFLHTTFLGECYSSIYVVDPEVDFEDENRLALEMARADIVDEIIATLVTHMGEQESLTIIDPETHDARLITLSKCEEDDDDLFDILDDPDILLEATV